MGEHYHRMLTSHLRMDGSIPAGSVIFVGDSLTQGLCVSAITEASVNYGIGSDTTAGVLQRLPKYHAIKECRAVVLAIGINDLQRRSDDEILHNYSKIISAIPSSTPVIVSSILPVDERINPTFKGYNARLHWLNVAIRKLLEANGNCHFVDTGPNLVDPGGNLDAIYHVGDGVHLSTRGYSLWIADLKACLTTIPPRARCAGRWHGLGKSGLSRCHASALFAEACSGGWRERHASANSAEAWHR